jgi:integrase
MISLADAQSLADNLHLPLLLREKEPQVISPQLLPRQITLPGGTQIPQSDLAALAKDTKPKEPRPRIRFKGPNSAYVYLEIRHWSCTRKTSCGSRTQTNRELSASLTAAYLNLVRICEEEGDVGLQIQRWDSKHNPTFGSMITAFLEHKLSNIDRIHTKLGYESKLGVITKLWHSVLNDTIRDNRVMVDKRSFLKAFMTPIEKHGTSKHWKPSTFSAHFVLVKMFFEYLVEQRSFVRDSPYDRYGRSFETDLIRTMQKKERSHVTLFRHRELSKYYSYVALRLFLEDKAENTPDFFEDQYALITFLLISTGRRPASIRRMRYHDSPPLNNLLESYSVLYPTFDRLTIFSKTSQYDTQRSIQFKHIAALLSLRHDLRHSQDWVFLNALGDSITHDGLTKRFKSRFNTWKTQFDTFRNHVADHMTHNLHTPTQEHDITFGDLTPQNFRRLFSQEQFALGTNIPMIEQMTGHTPGNGTLQKYYLLSDIVEPPQPEPLRLGRAIME